MIFFNALALINIDICLSTSTVPIPKFTVPNIIIVEERSILDFVI